MAINKVVVSGNLGTDAETRATKTGTILTVFRLCYTQHRQKDESGQYQNVPGWITCIIVGRRGEKLAKYLKKGSSVALEGHLRWSEYEDKNGKKQTSTELSVDELFFGSTKAEELEIVDDSLPIEFQ